MPRSGAETMLRPMAMAPEVDARGRQRSARWWSCHSRRAEQHDDLAGLDAKAHDVHGG
jgi:hypothetical protein